MRQFCEQPELRYSERTQLDLETDEPLQSILDHAGHRPSALVRLHGLGNRTESCEQERASSDSGVHQRDIRRGKPLRPIEPRPERAVDETDHRGDDLRRRVV